MTVTTTRMAIPTPESGENPNIPSHLLSLAQRVDLLAVMFSQGVKASRPAAAIAGRIYYATDEVVHYWDTGSAWVTMGTTLSPGTVMYTADDVVPTGFLACNGQAVSRTTYANLFANIGVVYGVGDGSTTFNLPDLQGREIISVGTHADVNALGKTEGVAAANRRPKHFHNGATTDTGSHSHSIDAVGNHTHTLASQGSTNVGGNTYTVTSGTGSAASLTTDAGGAHNHTMPAGGTHNHNVQVGAAGLQDGPAFIVLQGIIKI